MTGCMIPATAASGSPAISLTGRHSNGYNTGNQAAGSPPRLAALPSEIVHGPPDRLAAASASGPRPPSPVPANASTDAGLGLVRRPGADGGLVPGAAAAVDGRPRLAALDGPRRLHGPWHGRRHGRRHPAEADARASRPGAGRGISAQGARHHVADAAARRGGQFRRRGPAGRLLPARRSAPRRRPLPGASAVDGLAGPRRRRGAGVAGLLLSSRLRPGQNSGTRRPPPTTRR